MQIAKPLDSSGVKYGLIRETITFTTAYAI